LSLGNLLFEVAHWVLAWYYYRTAFNIPEVLEAAQRGYEPELKKVNHYVLWSGIAFIVFTGVAVFYAFSATSSTSSVVRKAINATLDAFLVVQLVITGVLLIYSVILMVRYLGVQENGA